MKNIFVRKYKPSISLDQFFEKCLLKGYKNNSSAKSLKLGFEKLNPTFWIAEDENGIFAISGGHKINKEDSRLAFRSCIIDPPFVFKKNYPNCNWWKSSFTANFLLPLQIQEFLKKSKNLYVTTNITKENHKLQFTNTAVQLLSRSGIVSKTSESLYFNCLQNFWKVHHSRFLFLIHRNKSNLSGKYKINLSQEE